MSQRPRSLIEYELRETHSDNTQRATNIRVRLAVELLLDLRDTANEILAEMKRVEITGNSIPEIIKDGLETN